MTGRIAAWTALMALVAGSAAASAAIPAGMPTGLWLTQDHKGAVRIYSCGAGLCGRLVWMAVQRTPDGSPLRDRRNTSQPLRDRPLCGLMLMRGFQPDGPADWDGGTIYNPEDGQTYQATLHLTADGRLDVRGYVGIPLFGKSQVWTRAPASLGHCTG